MKSFGKYLILIILLFVGYQDIKASINFNVNGIYYTTLSSQENAVTVVNHNGSGSCYSGNIVIPATVEYQNTTYNVISISRWAFSTSKIESLSLPNSISSIGEYAFYQSLIPTLIIPSGVKSIGSGCFKGCNNLSSLELSNTIETIGERAFEGCINLHSLVIPNSVNTIGTYAFLSCENLESIVLSYNITNLSDNLFDHCFKLKTIEIPNSVQTIGNECFYNCESIVFVSIPNSVTSIGYSAFFGCSNLERVTLPSNLSAIPNSCFWDCSKLSTIDLPKTIKSIGSNSFRNTGLTSVILPKDLTSIEDGAFRGCQGLEKVKSEIYEPFFFPRHVFANKGGNFSKTATLYVPYGTKEKYLAKQYWNESFKDIIEEVKTYEFSITASGNGFASFNNTNIRNNTILFTVNEGTTATINFTPDNGYRIKSVKKDGYIVTPNVTNNQYTVNNIMSDTYVDVEFEEIPLITYTLSVTAIGYGSASYNNTTIRNSTKSFQINEGTSATITFTPDNGYRIKSVKKDGSSVSVTNSQFTVSNIQSNTTIVVEFEAIPPITYSLSITASGYGHASYDNTSIRNTTKTFIVNEGTSPTITFAPDDGNRIKHIKKNGSSVSVTNNQYTISNIQSDTNIEVEFEAIPIPSYYLTIKASGHGSVSYNESSFRNSGKQFSVTQGSSAIISITPDGGYRIKSVIMNEVNETEKVNNNQYIISNIQSDVTLEIDFEEIPSETYYTLSISAQGNGYAYYVGYKICNTTSLFSVNEGTSHTITFIPDDGYRIKSVKKDGVNITSTISNNRYVVNNIQVNTTLDVEFEAIPVTTYDLTISATGSGYASYSGSSVRNSSRSFYVNEGTSPIITITPDNGYRIKTLKKNGSIVLSNNSSSYQYTISNISANTTVEVEFEAIPVTTYTLSISATGSGYVSYGGYSIRNSTRTYTVNAGTSPTITITPDNGYRIKSIKKNGTTVASSISSNYQYTASNISANTTVAVEFEAIPVTTYDLTISATGSGAASYSGYSIRNSSRSFYANEGTSPIITITPDNGYRIKTLKKNGSIVLSNHASSYQYTVSNISANTTIAVEFEAIPVTTYDLTISATGGGYVSYSGSSIRNNSRSFYANAGSSPVITITPDNGYRIKTLKKNGSTVLSNHSSSYQYTVSNISANTTVAVEFEAIPVTTYTLSIKATGYGSASYNNTAVRNTTKSFTVNAGTSAVVTLSPDNGYRIKSMKKNGTDVTSNVASNKYTVSSIQSNTTIEVEFETVPVTTYGLTISTIGGGYASYNAYSVRDNTRTFTVNAGSSPVITIRPDDGFWIKTLKKNGSTVLTNYSTSYQYTVSNISANTTVAVEFEEIPATTYSLTVKATGNGSASFASNTVRNGSKAISVNKGASVSISFTPDNGYHINYVRVNNVDRTSYVANYQYTVSTISSDTSVEVDFAEDTKAFTYQNINYSVSSYPNKTIKLTKGNYGRVLEVPAKVTYQSTEWTVVGSEADALDGNESLSAVIWHPNALFTARASNPNLLLYVNDGTYAQTTIHNVIANGTAQSIILTDATSGNEFYCPQRFVAQNISYTHHYRMETGINEARGWETLVLPFDVEKITHESKGSAVPFVSWRSGDAARPFWLMQLDNSGWKEAESIKANRPYIISMPNNANYLDEFLLNGAVTFSATNATIDKTENLPTASYSGRTFIPNYAEIGMGDGAYALNVSNDIETNVSGASDGSRFVLNLRKVHPFEAYMTTSTRGTRSIDISDGMGIIDNNNDEERISVYNMKGMMMKTNTGYSMEEIRRSLPAGVYIINKRKVLVK